MRRIGLAALLVVLTSMSHVSRTHAAPGCDAECASCRRDCNNEYKNSIDDCRLECIPDEILTAYDNCKQGAVDRFEACANACPGFPGRCTLTRECITACAGIRSRGVELCERGFGIRRRLKGCACIGQAKEARKFCRSACGLAATAPRTTTVSPAGAIPEGLGATCGQSCNRTARTCLQDIVGSCYAQCSDRCEGNGRALSICQRACRNKHCGRIRACETVYTSCCEDCDSCSPDGLPDGAYGCRPTTTLRGTTTSTTAVTTTTLGVGVTTTTVPTSVDR